MTLTKPGKTKQFWRSIFDKGWIHSSNYVQINRNITYTQTLYLNNLVTVRFIIKTFIIKTFFQEISIRTNFVSLKMIDKIGLEEIQDMEVQSRILGWLSQIQFINLKTILMPILLRNIPLEANDNIIPLRSLFIINSTKRVIELPQTFHKSTIIISDTKHQNILIIPGIVKPMKVT